MHTSNLAIRAVLRSCIASHAENAMVWYLLPVHFLTGTIFKHIVNTHARSVAWFLLDDLTLPNMFTKNILVYQYTRYILLALEITLVVAFLLACICNRSMAILLLNYNYSLMYDIMPSVKCHGKCEKFQFCFKKLTA